VTLHLREPPLNKIQKPHTKENVMGGKSLGLSTLKLSIGGTHPTVPSGIDRFQIDASQLFSLT
jgi:hypothetical protein